MSRIVKVTDVETTQKDIDAQFVAFGQQLRHAREKTNDWSRRDLERITGVSTSTIVRAERGERVRLETYLQITGPLGLAIPPEVMTALVSVEGDVPNAVASQSAPAWFLEHMAAAEERARVRHEEVTAMLRRALTALDAAV